MVFYMENVTMRVRGNRAEGSSIQNNAPIGTGDFIVPKVLEITDNISSGNATQNNAPVEETKWEEMQLNHTERIASVNKMSKLSIKMENLDKRFQ